MASTAFWRNPFLKALSLYALRFALCDSISSRYTFTVRSATFLQENNSSTRRRPNCPIFLLPAGSARIFRMAAARAFGSLGGTRMPAPSSPTTSGRAPVAVATTGSFAGHGFGGRQSKPLVKGRKHGRLGFSIKGAENFRGDLSGESHPGRKPPFSDHSRGIGLMRFPLIHDRQGHIFGKQGHGLEQIDDALSWCRRCSPQRAGSWEPSFPIPGAQKFRSSPL